MQTKPLNNMKKADWAWPMLQMPPAGGIAAPVLTALRGPVPGKPAHCIDSATYIEMSCDSTNCHIYFTTDGTRPNPEQRKVNGREVTFKYRAPFCLKPGKRVVKAVAMHRVTRQMSVVTTRTYHCEDIHGWNETEDCYDDSSVTTESTAWDSDLEDGLRTRKGPANSTNRRRAWDAKMAEPSPSPLDELGIPPDQGFAAVNHSGTQINLYGGGPPNGGNGGGFGGPAGGVMGWEVRTPNNVNFRGGLVPPAMQQQALPAPEQGVTPQQLNLIAAQLSQRMDETRQSTLQDIRRLVEDTKKQQQPLQQQQQPIAADPACLPVSKGDGDFKKQLQHVYAHLLQYARTDANFQAAVGDPKFGKVLSAELDESDDSYLLTVHIGKPGYKKPLHAPKSQPSPPKPKLPPTPTKKDLPAKRSQPPPPPPPPNHQVESEVKQTSHEKADAIKLKAPEEKPPEPVGAAYFQQEEYVQDGTLKPYPGFNATADAEQLRNAMKGLGTNEESIINVLGHRTMTQRMEIVRAFKMKFGKDLKAELNSELSGNFNKICQNLCLGAAEYDAMELRAAMKGLGTNEDCLIEIICTRTQAQVQEITKTYKNMFNLDLEADVMSETSGHFKRILVSLLTGARPEGSSFDPVQAKKDAQALQEAGIGKWGTDESKFNEILCGNNNAHLRAVFAEYEGLTGKTLEDSLKSEMSGDLLNAMLTLVRCVQNKPAYFAKALQKSMKGLGTNDQVLLRIVISRCEVDMVQIKDAFQKEFGQSLAQWIKDDTSGDYCKILLALIGEN